VGLITMLLDPDFARCRVCELRLVYWENGICYECWKASQGRKEVRRKEDRLKEVDL